MAFTAGSLELAKANKLGNQLAKLIPVFTTGGLTGSIGGPWTGGSLVEKQARKLGFGITGLTTGTFPPFGTVSATAGLEASLQNPRGETMASGITLGPNTGNTLGIFLKKFVRSGADYRSTMFSGVTLALGYTSGGGNTFWARGPISVVPNDTIVFSDASYIVAPGGATSAVAGATAAFRVLGTVTSTYATGAAFDVASIGITRGTSGAAGTTFEGFARGTQLHAGFTASLWFNYTAAAGVTWNVS